ncbi:hypothetical protein [Amycolatopsis sp. NPDC058986]|uniref:hypothetical protein n=1 Tax=unclassified Amycolatopsis TaxID=2618356 RepID=UPI00366FC3E0
MRALPPTLFLATLPLAAVLTGCGSAAPPATPSPAPARQAAAAEPTPTGAACGDVRGPGGKTAKVVAHGKVDCAQAVKLFVGYFAKLPPEAARSATGAGPLALGEWTCGSGPGDPVTTCSTEDDRQVSATTAG